MDKLKPIIAHHFWILFGLALILPFVGYWMATGQLSAEITERRTKLDNALNGIPQGMGSPNDSWITAVQQYNQKRAERNKQAHRLLWKRQTELYTWPDDIRADMERCEYRGAIESGEAATRVPNLYREDYETEVRRVWRLADPLDPLTAKGKLEFPLELMPRVPISEWQNRAPTFQEIWDAQEDLWLLTDLFQAISRVNDGTNSIADAYIRKIEEIRLFGAERGSAAPSGGMGGGGMPGEMGGMDEYAGMGMEMGMPGMGMGGGGGMGQRDRNISADFNLTEEFSNIQFGSGSGNRAGGGGGGMGMGMGSAGMMPEMDMAADMPGGGGMGGGAASREVRRYVDDEEGLPYRTRGFYMKVTIDHRRVPDLLVELTNSRWPVEIIRVHQVSRGGRTSTTGGMYDDMAMGGSSMSYMPGYADDMPDDYAGGGSYEEEMAMSSGLGSSMMPPGLGGSTMGRNNPRLRGLAQAAMADPNLATVVVAGLITLYNEPEAEPEAAEPADTGTTEPVDATTEDAATPDTDAGAETSPDASSDPEAQPAAESSEPASPANEETASPSTAVPETSEASDAESVPETDADAAETIDPGDASEPAPASTDQSPPAAAAP